MNFNPETDKKIQTNYMHLGFSLYILVIGTLHNVSNTIAVMFQLQKYRAIGCNGIFRGCNFRIQILLDGLLLL